METLDLQKQEAVLKEKETSQSLIDELQVTKNVRHKLKYLEDII